MAEINAPDKIEDCEGYRKLKDAVEADQKREPGRDFASKMAWAVDRAKHYAEKTGLSAADILNSWEKSRDYWYMNYYQDANLPLIEGESVRVFDTVEELSKSISGAGFRCPACDGVSRDPYACDTGIKKKGKVCDWKVYGLFGDLGKGVYVFVKAEMRGQRAFKPLAWETEAEQKGRTTKPSSKPKPEPVAPALPKASAGFQVDDEVGYKSVKSDTEFQHVGLVIGVYPDGIPSSEEPMLKIKGKSGVVLASHCTLIKRGS